MYLATVLMSNSPAFSGAQSSPPISGLEMCSSRTLRSDQATDTTWVAQHHRVRSRRELVTRHKRGPRSGNSQDSQDNGLSNGKRGAFLEEGFSTPHEPHAEDGVGDHVLDLYPGFAELLSGTLLARACAEGAGSTVQSEARKPPRNDAAGGPNTRHNDSKQCWQTSLPAAPGGL